MAHFLRFGALALLVLLAAGAAPAPGGPAPAPGKVVHYLPFPADVTYEVWQGNDQGPSHDDTWNRHAFDFSPMPESSPICATADGTVVYAGDGIGRAGNTGNSRGRHLHFGLRGERRTGPSIPCRFEDVSGGGAPSTGLVLYDASVMRARPRPRLMALLLAGLLLGIGLPAASAGEALPPGPPWKTDWPSAKREAVRTGRPIFAYFTKKH